MEPDADAMKTGAIRKRLRSYTQKQSTNNDDYNDNIFDSRTQPCHSSTSGGDSHDASLHVDRHSAQNPDDDSLSIGQRKATSVCSNSADSNTVKAASSKYGSVQSSASLDRRRLQIQLEFAKKKQEQIQKVLDIEEALQLATLNEEEELNEMETKSRISYHSSIKKAADWVRINHQSEARETGRDNRRDDSKLCREQHENEPPQQFREQQTQSRPVHQFDKQGMPSRQSELLCDREPCKRHEKHQYFEQQKPSNLAASFQEHQCQQNRTRSPARIVQHEQPTRDSYAEFNNPEPRINHIENWISRQSVNKELPKFSGNPLEWPQFISHYTTTTNLCKLSSLENQMRLQKSLSGQALNVVQSLLIYPQNVDRVIEILRNRFGRTDYIVHLLLDRVRVFPLIKEEKISSLIDFFDTLSNVVYTLESLNENDHIRNPILYHDILNKLPTRYKVDFVQYFDELQTNSPPIIVLHQWLERKVSAVSQLLIPSKSLLDEKDSKHFKSKGLTFAISEDDVKKTDTSKTNLACELCKENGHSVHSCKKFLKLAVDDRWNFVSKNYVCFSCLKGKHSMKTCKRKKPCPEPDCTRFHHALLHKPINFSNQAAKVVENNKTSNATNCHIHDSNALLKIIPIQLKGPKAQINSFALLDEGSTVSLIDSSLANDLGLDGPKRHLRLQWTNNHFNDQKDSQIVSVSIKGMRDSDKLYSLRHIKTVDGLSLPRQTVDVDQLSLKFPYLDKFRHLSYSEGQPMMIIGQDNWPLVVTRKILHGCWNGPAVSKTLLGWSIHGNVSFSETDSDNSVAFHVFEVDAKTEDKDDLNVIQDFIKQQWSFDISGTEVETDNNPSADDKRCFRILEETVKKVGNRFETGLFWKNDRIKLPDSKTTALKRLECLERKMDKNPLYSKQYEAKIDEYISKGYLKKLSEAERQVENPKVWYLPHFGVVNPNKPQKLRIVFDAAAKSNDKCLNDYLLTGPDLYNSLPNILMNFRIHKVAFVADIKEMFLQILVREEDRPAQRLLWRGSERDSLPDVYELQVVFFGAKCSPCIAQGVMAKNAEAYISEYPVAVKEIIDRHYMDDYLGGAETVEKAIRLIKDIIHIHANAGFQICNWVSSSTEVLSALDTHLVAERTNKEFSFDNLDCEERVLGVWWNYLEDNFVFKLKFNKVDKRILSHEKRPTKRDILKIVMAIFDPLGFLSNLVIVGKILMQTIWATGIDWDDTINDDQFAVWEKWNSNLNETSLIKIPRLVTNFQLTDSNVQLHIFCDASRQAYATVAYLRFCDNTNVQCALINSKARVAPLKAPTIPRLELQAALLGARLSVTIRQSIDLQIKETFLWSDSKTVLHWIKSSSQRYKTFVSNRIGEIQNITDPEMWNYVPTKLNIADDATKFKPIDFSSNSIWFRGPEFLYSAANEWPKANNFQTVDIDETEELNRELVSVITQVKEFPVPDPVRFTKWSRYLRTTAWVVKYIDCLKTRHPRPLKRKPLTELTPEYLAHAELLIFRKVQYDCYGKELDLMRNNKQLPKSSPLCDFSILFDDNEFIRIRGRLKNALELTEDARSPIILGHKHDITNLLVRHVHELNHHIGKETIISDLRKRFWITNIRSLVQKISHACQYCRNMKSKPEIPIMGQLPTCRVVKTERPFMKCGVDLFGPLEITVGRRREKRYGVIFTCMTMRAIHIELVHDLSCNAFMHALRQFGSRRGYPVEIYSDNGTNFRRADKEIREARKCWPENVLISFCAMQHCKWIFNPPIAPHMGGAWERLIQSIKKHLHYVLKEKFPREYVLRTFLCEIEFIINNRPITYNSSDIHDATPLTPNDILIGPRTNNFPLQPTTDSDLTILSMWQASQRLADTFWKRWVSEYLPTILHSKKWSRESKNLSIGDLVLIVDGENPRNCWPKGRIVQVFPAKDGRVRVVDVETVSGRFRRPVVKLIKLNV